MTKKEKFEKVFERNYKILMFIPVLILILSLISIAIFYSNNGELFSRDVSLSGGTTLTIQGNFNVEELETFILEQYPDTSFRVLTDFSSGQSEAIIIESSAESQDLISKIENYGIELTDENSSVEFTGPSLSNSFYKQLIIALIISFIAMSLVILIMFRTFIPSIAVIFAGFSDIVFTLAMINLLEIKLSAAGIAAFLMLIGYSVDTDILLTTRALKKGEGSLNGRIFSSFKTGGLMTLTALVAVTTSLFFVSGLPESFRQIFLVLGLGLIADIFNTWLTNVGIIKWYCTKKGIN